MGLAIVGLIHGVGLQLCANVGLGVAIVYFGMRVFAGDYSAVKVFAILVILSYLGLTATNILNYGDFPAESRAAQMAVPRMLRGILFAGVYAWYYFLRSRTVEGFGGINRGS
jgi:hypothetical protein